MKAEEVSLYRMVAQRLVGQDLTNVADVARWMTCMQAQDYPGARISLALRTAAGTLDDVDAALSSGEVLRSWPMRGTLHFVASEDIHWMLGLTTERLMKGVESRRQILQMDLPMVERAGDIAVAALTGGKRLDRQALIDLWAEAGLLEIKQRSYHFIWHLAQTGVLCYGPVSDGAQQIVLLDEWVPKPRVLEHDEALGDWALRYFLRHGPATAKDFGHWTKLTVKDVKTGIAVAGDRLASINVDGIEYLMDPALPDRFAAHKKDAAAVHLLPGFDELILGYQERLPTLAKEHAPMIVPGNNGMFLATIVHKGRVIGTWKRVGTGKNRRMEIKPFAPLSAKVEKDTLAAYDALASRPLGVEADH